VFTVLVYLNDDLEGGETEFLQLGLRHRGRKGDALMFRNVDAEGQPDRRTLHAGRPPTQGEKWLLSVWIRDRALPPEDGDPGLMMEMAEMAGR
jgi:prolyl 4-hydroxylase